MFTFTFFYDHVNIQFDQLKNDRKIAYTHTTNNKNYNYFSESVADMTFWLEICRKFDEPMNPQGRAEPEPMEVDNQAIWHCLVRLTDFIDKSTGSNSI